MSDCLFSEISWWITTKPHAIGISCLRHQQNLTLALPPLKNIVQAPLVLLDFSPDTYTSWTYWWLCSYRRPCVRQYRLNVYKYALHIVIHHLHTDASLKNEIGEVASLISNIKSGPQLNNFQDLNEK